MLHNFLEIESSGMTSTKSAASCDFHSSHWNRKQSLTRKKKPNKTRYNKWLSIYLCIQLQVWSVSFEMHAMPCRWMYGSKVQFWWACWRWRAALWVRGMKRSQTSSRYDASSQRSARPVSCPDDYYQIVVVSCVPRKWAEEIVDMIWPERYLLLKILLLLVRLCVALYRRTVTQIVLLIQLFLQL